MTAVRLTSLSRGAGCACKLSREELRGILSGLPMPASGAGLEVVVGHAERDDGAVWRSPGGRLNIATTDFFTPIVDDPFTWGRIAATNAVSDVYAMGGHPHVALNLVGWPRELPFEILAQVLDGAQEVAAAAGYAVLGGHSIDSAEPLFGLAVFGEIEPACLLTIAGAEPGDAVVLTKAIGTGIIMTAAKSSPEHEKVPGFDEAVASMTTLNADAARLAVEYRASAATDVTGFGLLGHLHGLATASGVAVRVDAGAVPIIPGTLALLDAGSVPGGTRRNASQSERYCTVPLGPKGDRTRTLLADAQTSGGLLITLPAARAPDLVQALRRCGLPARTIGSVVTPGPESPGSITVEGSLP